MLEHAVTSFHSWVGLKDQKLLPSVFERQAKGKSNIFTLLGLFAFLTYILLPQMTLSAVG